MATTWWIGAEADIIAAQAAASAIVCARPETLDGEPVPAEDKITERWAEPQQTIDGEWTIPRLTGMTRPAALHVAVPVWPEPPPLD